MSDHRALLRDQLRRHEGVRRKPYKDSVGKLTIGVGRNLEDKGLRPAEIDFMLENDMVDAESDARAVFPDFDSLSVNRRVVLCDMAFNLGRARLAGFKSMLWCLKREDYYGAAKEMRKSKWAAQVGVRAIILARQMERG